MSYAPRIFIVNGRTLEARAIFEANGFRVSVFEGENQVISESYHITYEDEYYAREQKFPIDVVQSLMDTAQIDVQRGNVKLK